MSKRLESMAAFVRAKRIELGLRQAGLAKLAGVSQPNISEIERGMQKEMEAATLIGLARAFKCDPRDVWHGKPTRVDRNTLTDDQAELVQLYSRLSQGDRQRLSNTAKAWLENSSPPPIGESPKH